MKNYIWRHDLTPQAERFEGELIEAAKRVLKSGRYILNQELEAFEREFAAYIGCSYGVGVGSGTDALYLALRAAGIGSGDEVITTTYAPTPTPAAIIMAGANPVFLDIEPGTCLMDPDLLGEAITPRTKAVIPVHLFGYPCKMDIILQVAKWHGLVVIEDAAQAHGSMIGSQKAGSLGDLSCFSFYPTKNLGGYGDGGMVLTSRSDLRDALVLLRNYGKKSDPFNSEIPGVNSRLDEIQAALLRVKLRLLDRMNEQREHLVRLYTQGLRDVPVHFLQSPEGGTPNHHILTILCPFRRDELARFLEARGIQTNVYYPQPLHAMPAYRSYVKPKQAFPQAEELTRQALALPLYPELKPSTVEFIIDRLKEFFSATKRPSCDPGLRRESFTSENHETGERSGHSISFIIPVYNEAGTIRNTLRSALAVLPKISPGFELVVVESGSTDKSLEIIREEAEKEPRIIVCHQERKDGMGSALREGYRLSSKEWVCHLEADLPFDFKEVAVASQYFHDFDFIRGVRVGDNGRRDGWLYSHNILKTVVRFSFHRGYNLLVRLLYGIMAPDINFSFKLIRTALVKELDLRTNGWFIDTELVLELKKAGARCKELPIKYCVRCGGHSSVTAVSPFPILKEALKYWFARWDHKPGLKPKARLKPTVNHRL